MREREKKFQRIYFANFNPEYIAFYVCIMSPFSLTQRDYSLARNSNQLQLSAGMCFQGISYFNLNTYMLRSFTMITTSQQQPEKKQHFYISYMTMMVVEISLLIKSLESPPKNIHDIRNMRLKIFLKQISQSFYNE